MFVGCRGGYIRRSACQCDHCDDHKTRFVRFEMAGCRALVEKPHESSETRLMTSKATSLSEALSSSHTPMAFGQILKFINPTRATSGMFINVSCRKREMKADRPC